MKTTNTTELIREMEQQIRDLKLENAELSCDGTQAREALTRARAKIEELKPLIEEMIEVMLYAISKVECIDYEYATRHRAKGLILKWQNIQQHLTINQ